MECVEGAESVGGASEGDEDNETETEGVVTSLF